MRRGCGWECGLVSRVALVRQTRAEAPQAEEPNDHRDRKQGQPNLTIGQTKVAKQAMHHASYFMQHRSKSLSFRDGRNTVATN